MGGYIGTFCIPTALCCAEKGIEVKSIQSFEPGPTHELLKINIDINELSDQITVHHAAMSSFDGYTKYRFRSGGSIGGAVFGNDDSDTMERIAPCFTIDGFCNGLEDQDGPMLVKLDTQGHEGKIMNRARKLISQKRAVWLIEFIAWTARSEIDDGRFADLLTNEFYVFEEHKEITSETMDAFIDEVDARPHRMADLILIPRDAPFTQKMLASIKEAS
ncbi:MAG: FkbM family methyltransferase [Ahrensia sp.]|nr:FkbM family methyltransferase [Ahrensia sp.]